MSCRAAKTIYRKVETVGEYGKLDLCHYISHNIKPYTTASGNGYLVNAMLAELRPTKLRI